MAFVQSAITKATSVVAVASSYCASLWSLGSGRVVGATIDGNSNVVDSSQMTGMAHGKFLLSCSLVACKGYERLSCTFYKEPLRDVFERVVANTSQSVQEMKDLINLLLHLLSTSVHVLNADLLSQRAGRKILRRIPGLQRRKFVMVKIFKPTSKQFFAKTTLLHLDLCQSNTSDTLMTKLTS